MLVTLIAAIVYLFTIPQRHLADNFSIKLRCQLLTETLAVNFWLKVSVLTFDWNCCCRDMTETFHWNFRCQLLIANRCQFLITARAVEPSSALLNSNCGMLILVEGSIRKLLSKAKEKYRGIFEIQKSGDKTSSREIGLDIRKYARPKVGQDQVSGGVSVLCWHAAPVAYVPWKPCTIW